MEKFVRELTDLLRKNFPDCDLEIESVGAGRFGGFIIWNGFEDMEQIDRQREVSKVIKSNLDRAKQSRISALLTMTPEEMASARKG